jgi:hypothetical protein
MRGNCFSRRTVQVHNDRKAEEITMHRQQVTPIGELFSLTWTQYKERAIPLLAVILINTVLISSLILVIIVSGIVGTAILMHFMNDVLAISIIFIITTLFLLVIALLLVWCQTAMLAIVVDKDLGIIGAFQRGWEYFWPMTWVLTFLTGILISGFTFGIVPGFLCLVWFSFSIFIMFDENRRGLDTLLASREYVRGYGWNTFGKMIVAWLISLIIGILPLIGQILSMLFTPFFLLYILAIYRDLKSIKGTVELDDAPGTRIFWWAVTIIGMIIPIAALFVVLYFLLTGDQQWIMHTWQGMHGTNL